MANVIDFDRLWSCASEQYHGSVVYSVHGPSHWKRVEQNGLLLATKTGADLTVVRLFAIFHDSRRLNDGTDDGHGAREAAYAWAQRARAAGMPEREAMNHLGHESRAIHAAYAGGAQVAVLPLEFYETQKEEKVIQFKQASQQATSDQANEVKKASHG